MLPVGLLYKLSSYLLDGKLPGDKSVFFIAEIVVALILIVLTTIFQYRSTFLSTYIESGVRRRTLAEKLRKIPLSFFGKKDLTNTIMTDCATIETASSHWIPELVGAIISTTIVVINLAGDVNKDGKVDSKDAVIILKYYAATLTGFTGSIDKFNK